MDPTIKNGDVAIIKLNIDKMTYVLAGVYIILLNNKLLLKRIQYDPVEDGYHLINDNTTFKNHLIKQDSLTTPFQVIAKVEHILTNVF